MLTAGRAAAARAAFKALPPCCALKSCGAGLPKVTTLGVASLACLACAGCARMEFPSLLLTVAAVADIVSPIAGALVSVAT
jgi:hypothetical protein